LFLDCIELKPKSKKFFDRCAEFSSVKVSAQILCNSIRKKLLQRDATFLKKLATACEQLIHSLCSAQTLHR